MRTLLFLLLSALILGACGRMYPERGADLSLLGAGPHAVQGPVRPLTVHSPARVGVVRLGGVYAARAGVSRTSPGVAEAFERLRELPGVATVQMVESLPEDLMGSSDATGAIARHARRLGLDAVLVYSVGTEGESGSPLAPLAVVTLGLFPGHVTTVRSQGAAVLLDAHSGARLGAVEARADTSGLANSWTAHVSDVRTRERAETDAALKLVDSLRTAWPGIVAASASAPWPVVAPAPAPVYANPHGHPGPRWPAGDPRELPAGTPYWSR